MPNPAPVAVLSFHFWQEHYHGSRDVIGKTSSCTTGLTRLRATPPRFAWFDTDVYLPGKPTADIHDHRMAFPKLKPGIRYPTAEAELQALVAGVREKLAKIPIFTGRIPASGLSL